MRAAPSLNTEDVAGQGNTKPRPDAAKTEISSGIADVSDKFAYSGIKIRGQRPQGSRAARSHRTRDHRAPVADRSLSLTTVARRRTHRERGGAFDPSKNPNAPGAPRPLGTIVRPVTTNYASAEYSSARVVPSGDAFDPFKNPNAPGAPRPLGTIARPTTANYASAEYSSARVVPRTRRERGDALDPSKNPNAPGTPQPLGTAARTTTANSASASNQRQTTSSPTL